MAPRKKVNCPCGSTKESYPFKGERKCDDCLYGAPRPVWKDGPLPESSDEDLKDIAERFVETGGRLTGELGRADEKIEHISGSEARRISEKLNEKIAALSEQDRKRLEYIPWQYGRAGRK